ncbi:MAG: 5'-deoxynucleotidase [Clostridia bacterium]
MSEGSFFAYVNRMKYITRWGLMRNTHAENITEHSLQVAMFAHALAVIRKVYFPQDGRPVVEPEKVATMAMFHDCSEILTGDLPTPIKYHNPAISKAYKDVERVAIAKLLTMLPNELQQEYEVLFVPQEQAYIALIKAADKLAAYLKCVEETKGGNPEFKKALEENKRQLEAMEIPEVKYFMETFEPQFWLSLDELD